MVNMHSFPYIENIEKNDIFLKIIQMHFSQIVLHVLKLEAQWAESVSLTFHSVFRKLYTEPSTGASYQISIHLATPF